MKLGLHEVGNSQLQMTVQITVQMTRTVTVRIMRIRISSNRSWKIIFYAALIFVGPKLI